ncbi:arsenosugar biosynthesis radical SAM (seleno)protein ArsS [cyanobacterium endosymbiont of Epithemia clementina EcSB]|uniref:arsenosugar biosynthesis radical SAM (seleno)protein ArsS n=1 Tax=cyanobacterium endosymbiont of Epithemia clementina EcSB TaxID=3034674 RepID=UPI00248177F4|nr:arsenosugar biosynthesis radical SAM (seleno)protein ArsS [cyanobacterium endosymbiont of Epithemia clementina EcSB]WGT67621.1 arsenosugar biosynthesis radical SAM protein ArsS [cyanobacterium endosymbiont of Epithemia clementina EcSB]
MTIINLSKITPFKSKINHPLNKQRIKVLQINLGKRCNLTCIHCHVEAGPKRTEELSPEICQKLIDVINRFHQIETVDLTGGAPEMNYGFRPLIEAARNMGKQVIVRSNLTIYFEPSFEDIPEYCAKHQVRIIASFPCYLEDNVDTQRGKGVYNDSIKALRILNKIGYGNDSNLRLDLVYNPPIPRDNNFILIPSQNRLEKEYKKKLKNDFNIIFNSLFTIINMPVGRTKKYLQNKYLYFSYLEFLKSNYNELTLSHLMCKNQLSIDYNGNIYDCDFNQTEDIFSTNENGEPLTIKKLLTLGNLDIIKTIKTAPYCYGCTAGSGSSCRGSLV